MTNIFDPSKDPSQWPLFQEEDGSPREQYGKDGFSARRVFYCPWVRKDEALESFLGSGLGIGADGLGGLYPDKPNIIVSGLQLERFGSAPDTFDIDDPNIDLNDYPDGLAKLSVSYKKAQTVRPDAPEVDDGYLDYEMNYGVEAQIVGSGELRIGAAGNQKLENNADLVFYNGTIDHRLSWNKVQYAPFKGISKCRGCVNDREFLGAPAGTVLFEGARLRDRFYFSNDPEKNDVYIQMDYTFKEKQIINSQGGFVGGWNYVYVSEPAANQGWNEVRLSDGSLPYKERDFRALLFTQETP